MHSQTIGLPIFTKTNCSAELCVKVTFIDSTSDLIIANEVKFDGSPTGVFKGHLVSNLAKAVIVVRDSGNPNGLETVVFKSQKSVGCTKFQVDLLNSGKATCLKHRHVITDEFNLGKNMDNQNRKQTGSSGTDNLVVNPVSNVLPKEGEVCTTIKIKTTSGGQCSGFSWKFGSCQSQIGEYESYNTYHQECCQPPGNYTLECNSGTNTGWQGSYIQIGDSPTKYCRYWNGKKLTRNVLHQAKDASTKVCTKIKLQTGDYGEEISWKFGSCKSKRVYRSHHSYDLSCCQPAGNYTLECKDKLGDGWHGGYIQIGASPTQHCSDWHGHRTAVNLPHRSENKKVCLKIMLSTKSYADDISWKYGSCKSNQIYKSNSIYHHECCQPEGYHTLECIDKAGDGWKGSYINIGGKKFCNNWSNTKVTEHVEHKVSRKPKKSIARVNHPLSSNGYKLKVAVYYDDKFARYFGNLTVKRVTAVMAIVDEMYSEKDTLTTEIKVETVGIEHAKGYDWSKDDFGEDVIGDYGAPPDSVRDCRRYRTCTAERIARNSKLEANLYVFLTVNNPYLLGVAAKVGSVCDIKRARRTNISSYTPQGGAVKDGDSYTAETIAHEIGHNLGMYHDHDICRATWDNSSSPRLQRIVRKLNGKQCYGYMDYNDFTNQWSHCSASDLKSYMNKVIKEQRKFCLEKLP